LEDISNLSETFERVLATNDDPLICDRNTFVRVIMQLYLKTDHKAVNQLYSSFDPDRTDMLDYRDFIAALRVFRNPTETARAKLEAIFRIYCHEGEATLPKPVVKQILYTCCASLVEKEHLDDCISAKVGKQMRAQTALHQRQQYVSRESFFGVGVCGLQRRRSVPRRRPAFNGWKSVVWHSGWTSAADGGAECACRGGRRFFLAVV
jgi:Ca2+-binding EF-hand superfamily protein